VVTPHIREIVLAIEDTHMNTPTAVQLLRNSLDRFLAKDMKGWTELCDENVVAEFLVCSGRFSGEDRRPIAFTAAMAGTRFDDSAK